MDTPIPSFLVDLPERAPEPRWWTGTAPIDAESFVIDCAGMDINAAQEPDSDLGRLMRETYDRVGLVHLVNTGLTELSEMRSLARHVLPTDMEYRGGANPRDRLQPNVYEIGAPLTAFLHYHHEMAYVGKSTKALGFLCSKATPGKGETFVSDNAKATEALLDTSFGRKLAKHGVCYHRNLTDREAFAGTDEMGVYNHWQKSMMTEDPREAERQAQERGLVTEWGPDRLLMTRYYSSAFEYFEPLDRNLLFSSMADDAVWFDSWPKVMHLPHRERPLWMTFGNDEEFTAEDIHTFINVYDEFGMPIRWNVGDVAIVCNYRWAHGRPSVHLEPGQERVLGVMIGEQFDRRFDVPGKW